jgi:CelD/BcsL family acetyltransferase involved in cellulose biosynthesis
VTVATLESEPDCARPTRSAAAGEPAKPRLRAERRPFDTFSRETWDRLAGRNPWATPFSAWGFHRAWWDAYGENAHDQTLAVVCPDDGERLVAIVPLMHRHVVEVGDAEVHTSMRHGTEPNLTPVSPTAKAVYFGASYHADYASILGDPSDLPDIADAVVTALGSDAALDPDHPRPWDIVDLRRLRTGDPTADAFASAFGAREMAEGWTLNVEAEDVCPVAKLPGDGTPGAATIDDFLATLGKHDRHEIRRKVRRAETAGDIQLVESTDPLDDLQSFIELHQAKWGDDGLFPPTRGGDQSRVFVSRMLELLGPDTTAALGTAHLSFLTLDGTRIGASIFFETRDSLLYYNAGVSPDARHLSPGIVMVERLVRHALARGLTRLDFLRGNESYKYEWGSLDEPIQRLLVRRTGR